jgi:2-succinyl-5-enolpyruvyl-6-hydroxy-3-cyclohexene-1-carboxylate synthase
MPAVVEAHHARVPLVVLTADRPHELRDCGAPQTIDQVRLYGAHAKWFVDLPEPDASPDVLRYARTIACRAVAESRRGPAGPVHLNCPMREPLVPLAAPGEPPQRAAGGAWPDARPYVTVSAGRRTVGADVAGPLAADLARAERGLIVCGPQDDPALAPAVARLAGALGYPLLADPLSGVRCGPHDRSRVLDCYDAVLRDAAFVDQHAPEVVLRFGAMPTSKPVLLFLQRHAGCRQVVVDGDGGWSEPTGLAADVVHADAALLCDALAPALSAGGAIRESAWLLAWLAADRAARAALSASLARMDELFEGKALAEVAALLPDGATLYAGNSMPVRDLDTFVPGSSREVRFLANRGANGIDGVVSSALGAAAASPGRPLVLVIGDLALYHDSNGLLAARQHELDVTIVLLNNDGGGIFSFLPQAVEAPEHFERLFGTPHGLDFAPLAELYGARYTRAESWPAFRSAVRCGISSGGLHLVELPTDRTRNVTLHRDRWREVSSVMRDG